MGNSSSSRRFAPPPDFIPHSSQPSDISRKPYVDFKHDVARRISKAQTPRERFDIIRHARKEMQSHPKHERARHKDILDAYEAHAKGTSFIKTPQRKDLKRFITHWTGGNYVDIQKARRTKGHDATPYAKSHNLAMAMYMRNHALRAPTMPSGMQEGQFYRGVVMPKVRLHELLGSGSVHDPGYLAFSRKIDVASSFSRGRQHSRELFVPVMFVLKTSDVPRGTPWIWFEGRNTPSSRLFGKPSSFETSHMSHESEVVLPPGALHLVRNPDKAYLDRLKQFHSIQGLVLAVTYEPDHTATSLSGGLRIIKKK